MKRIAASLFIVLICSLMPSCNNPELAKLFNSKKRYPIKRTLTDQQGRKIDASIVGRSANTLEIVRIEDRKSFELPINRLSKEDQTFARSLPLESASSDSSSGFTSRDSHTIDLNKKEIEELERQYKALEIELKRYQAGTMKYRSTLRRMEGLSAKMASLRADNYRLQR